ncbi:PAS domain-containing protein [Pseudooceanicola sp. 216_PA32_1]|uniref:PAS domain-containing protein n=1 Tax=Pseudooceanicola pacificus TaxID=2676438 RepID=A0A844WCS4_9RHOB|nr:PAS domain-containing protein [Pseudooceanicola pacificus]
MDVKLERIRGVFERSMVALSLADLEEVDCPLVLANARFETLTGFSFRETEGRNCRFLQGDLDNGRARADIRQAIENRTEAQVVLKNRRKSGEAFDNLLFLHPVSVGGQTSRYMLGSQFELTAAENTLEEAMAHAGALSGDLERIGAVAERLRMQRRRYLADASAALVTAWARRI